ncbi:MAG: sterol desaturase family protein [Alphaproteobacteria bacterium]|nr:sterol desaturase family protein [Alphaproteobacteria bacterium]
MDIISLSIPIFFLLIGVELAVSFVKGVTVYRFNDSINDLSTGILNQVLAVFTGGARIAIYAALYEHARLFTLPEGAWWTWVIALVGVDIGYYWFHRHSHEINAMWSAHVVHHQSEEYNLSVALRQSALEPLFSIWYRLPLAILGLDVVTFVTANAINTLYQFWVHTRLIKRLGPLEWFMTTPSHHRVHHGRNPKYLDRNYSGMFIVWDRLFGTFQVEEEEPAFGITKPLASWDPVYANLQHPIRVLQQAEGLTGLDRLLIWWHGPAWGNPPPPEPDYARKYDAKGPKGSSAYVFVHFLGAIAATLFMLFTDMGLAWNLALAGFITWTLVDIGAVFERRPWLIPAEAARMVFAAAIVGLLAGPLAAAAVGVLALGSALALARLKHPAREAVAAAV